jgi:hypothetical protein
MNLPTLIPLKQEQSIFKSYTVRKYLPLAVELTLHKQIANSSNLTK